MKLVLLSALAVGAFAGPWNTKALYEVPKSYPAPGLSEEDVTGVFIESLPWKGRPTRFFAWYAVPASSNGRRVPAMVLVHGGGGTAFAEWVRMWTRRGFAAIALDTCGSIPKRKNGNPWNLDRPRHEHSGPDGWGGFSQVDEPMEDQWTYHAVADILLAHSFLRSLTGLDTKRIGITGISWGGYLTSIAASVDTRFRFAIPVYGCGFLGEDSAWVSTLQSLGESRSRRWLELWDPSRYLPQARMPFLWVNGTNDFAYPMPSWQKSYRLPNRPRVLSLRVNMKHSHPDGARPEEIFAYAAEMTRAAEPLARFVQEERKGDDLNYRYRSTTPITEAALHCTSDSGAWKGRKWTSHPVQWDLKARSVKASLPVGAKACFVNLTDSRGLVVSSQHVEN